MQGKYPGEPGDRLERQTTVLVRFISYARERNYCLILMDAGSIPAVSTG